MRRPIPAEHDGIGRRKKRGSTERGEAFQRFAASDSHTRGKSLHSRRAGVVQAFPPSPNYSETRQCEAEAMVC